MVEYADTNRAFVQVLLARNILTAEDARPVLAAIFSVHEQKLVSPEDVTQQDFESMVSAANDALSPLDLEVRSAFHQETRERYYALVNTTSDALTQIATIHSPDEIAYVKRLLDAMFETNNTPRREAMCIAGKDALNLVRAGRHETSTDQMQSKLNMTQTEAENLLSQLVAEAWLEKSDKGFYSLSTRGLLELKGWLVETYNDEDEEEEDWQKIKFCQACKEIHTTGQRCSRQDCRVRLHNICTQNYFRSRRSRDCPACNTEWDGKHFVGEKAITTSESYLIGRRRSGAQPHLSGNDDGNGDGDGDDD